MRAARALLVAVMSASALAQEEPVADTASAEALGLRERRDGYGHQLASIGEEGFETY